MIVIIIVIIFFKFKVYLELHEIIVLESPSE